jgi:hypothetical protein
MSKKFPKLPKCFSNIGIFQECKILGKKNLSFIVCPKPSGIIKISSILEKLSQRKSPKVTNVSGSMRKTLCFPKLPKPFA